MVLLNHIHLNLNNQLKLPNFDINRSYEQTTRRTNCGGTAILIHHKLTHNHV